MVSKKRSAAQSAAMSAPGVQARRAETRKANDALRRRALQANLRAAMAAKGLKVSDISQALEVSMGQVYAWIRGSSLPHGSNVPALAALLGLTPDGLYSHDGPIVDGEQGPATMDTRGFTRPAMGRPPAKDVTIAVDLDRGVADLKFQAELPLELAMQIFELVKAHRQASNGNGESNGETSDA